MTNVLITGGSGLIGGNAVKALVDRGDNVTVIDLSPPRNPKMKFFLHDIWDKVNFVQGSTADDFPTLLKACKDNEIEKIFHAAAIFNYEYENTHPYYSLYMASQSMLNICEAARILDIGRIVFCGSRGEYDTGTVDKDPRAQVETHPIFNPFNGSSPYGAGKKLGSIIGMCYYSTAKIDWLNLRLSRVWGFGSKKTTEMDYPTMIENAIDGKPYKIMQGTEDQKRGLSYAKDMAQGVILALDVPNDQLKQRVFNIAGFENVSDRDAANVVRDLIPGANIELKGGGIDRRPMDMTAVKEQIGFVSSYDLRASIKDYIETYKEFKKSEYSNK
jgi:nucleoside-diphosphate-sugar epimerase